MIKGAVCCVRQNKGTSEKNIGVVGPVYNASKNHHHQYCGGCHFGTGPFSDLIDKKKKSLDLDKSEYDYRKSITEKTKNILEIEYK